MPNAPRTQHRSVRVPDDRWQAAADAAAALGVDRATWINAALAWLTGEEGARRPARPVPPVQQEQPPAGE